MIAAGASRDWMRFLYEEWMGGLKSMRTHVHSALFATARWEQPKCRGMSAHKCIYTDDDILERKTSAQGTT